MELRTEKKEDQHEKGCFGGSSHPLGRTQKSRKRSVMYIVLTVGRGVRGGGGKRQGSSLGGEEVSWDVRGIISSGKLGSWSLKVVVGGPSSGGFAGDGLCLLCRGLKWHLGCKISKFSRQENRPRGDMDL